MKASVVLAVLVIFTSSGSAQLVCRQAKSQIVEHRLGFTIQNVSLPSPSGPAHATAVIPDSGKAGDPAVFSFSTLLGSEPYRAVDMMPLAIELAKRGHATIVIERKLTWPDIAPSVGTMQPTELCAEQWLSTHAAVQPNHWRFVGPESDVPTLDQLHALGDTTSMTFHVWFPVGGPNENGNTENALRSTSPMLDFLLTPFLDEH
jgi:hypothetical protein